MTALLTGEPRRKAGLLETTVLVGIAALCMGWWTANITETVVESDAAQNLQLSLNLAKRGTFSLEQTGPYKPSMYREPFALSFTTAGVWLADAILGPADDKAYFSGQRARLVKLPNLAWMLLLASGIFVATKYVTGSTLLALIGALAVNVKLPMTATGPHSLGLDEVMTDLPAAAVLIWASLMLARASHEGRWLWFATAGLLFGIMALIKAAFLYVFVGVLLAALILGIAPDFRSLPRWRASAVRASILAACFIATVLPWMIRNYVQLGDFGIANRGGVVVLMRAEKDRMSMEEYKGTFYIWAPSKLRPLMAQLLGYTPADTRRHGRLQRIYREADADYFADEEAAERAGRPDKAITFYYKARAQRVELQRLAGTSDQTAEVDRELQKRATAIIREHFAEHLALTVPFLWRGAFTTFPALLLVLVYSAVRRRLNMTMFFLPAFGIVLFYALFSHFTPRYSVPVVGVVVVAIAALLKITADSLRMRFTKSPITQ